MKKNFYELVKNQEYPISALYIISTPIGNLGDITIRALYVLNLVDYIAAENTRNAHILLSNYNISKPLLLVNSYNESKESIRLIKYLKDGKRVAYISDSGTPGISDPGICLVESVRYAGFRAIPIPGSSSLTTALSISSYWASKFMFFGFLPKKKNKRLSILNKFISYSQAMIFYESPNRIITIITEFISLFGKSRRLIIARELTKLYEDIFCCTLLEGLILIKDNLKKQKGEFVLIVEGNSKKYFCIKNQDILLRSLLKELPLSTSVKIASLVSQDSKNILYSRALELQKKYLDKCKL